MWYYKGEAIIILLWTDKLLWLMLLVLLLSVLYTRRYGHVRLLWEKVFQKTHYAIALKILCLYMAIGLLDSIHIQSYSLLDYLFWHLTESIETTFSAPFSCVSFAKKEIPLSYACRHLVNPDYRFIDILFTIGMALIKALIVILAWIGFLRIFLKNKAENSGALVLWVFVFLMILLYDLSLEYHIFGTDKVGQDIFYSNLKSIRTGLVIGVVTTLFMVPFAVTFGLMAGYFGGIIDDIIQYLYTTLSSVPGVLLIAASVLSLQIYLGQHPEVFSTQLEQADLRLFFLCIILGVTNWAGLCRLIRAETLKLRTIEFVEAAKVLGSSHSNILWRHLVPNIMHLIIMTVAIDFSSLVLSEAVLSYVGVGVDPTTYSWGNMINSARLEMARVPVVWWSLMAGFGFMVTLVFAANIVAEGVRDVFDSRENNG